MKAMPLLFVGHGSPMNAIETNTYSQEWKKIADRIPTPKAIVVISAHWETHGTHISAREFQNTIYDFYGFPSLLYEATYNAPGSVALAKRIQELLSPADSELDYERGLDHGAWSVLLQMYPDKKIPVLQISLDIRKKNEYFIELGQKLRALREEGIMIIGSGNVVHNLRHISPALGPNKLGVEFEDYVKNSLIKRNTENLIHYENMGVAAGFSVPSREHYLPLLVICGASSEYDSINFYNSGITLGSISMLSVMYE
jgi:4,5-DOPA dioxygenase extradiol